MASKEKYWESSVDKQMLISIVGTNLAIDNSMIENGTFSLEESLCSESELKFGSCEANCVKFTAHNTAGSIVGKTISISETLDGDTENPTQYGIYKVCSDVPTSDRSKRQIAAYDAMYDIINADVKSWYAGLSFPMTLKTFRDSFFAYLGIEQEDISLVNDSMTVNKTLVAEQTDDSSAVTEESSISGKTVITAICEINGVFGNINRDGKFEYVILPNIISAVYPAEDLYPRNDLFPADANTESMSNHYITFDYEDFQSKAITQLEIRANDNTAGALVGTAGNNYVISGNFLVSDKTGAELEQIANNVFPIMKQAAYTPVKSSTCVGNPCLELGDPIRFNTSREIVETYILQRTLTGVQSKRDSIVAQGTETHSAKVNSMRETLTNVERRTGKLEVNADHMLAEYKDFAEDTNSRFEVAAGEIASEVAARQNADSEMSTRIAQTAHSVAITASGGENSVGLKVQLYDEYGNLIGESSDDANIIITGVVKFENLTDGSTMISGSNIQTGYISCDRLSGGTIFGQTLYGCRATFTDGADAVRIKYNDSYYMGLRAGYLWIHNASNPEVTNGIICDNTFSIGINGNTDYSLSPSTYIRFDKAGYFKIRSSTRPSWEDASSNTGYSLATTSDLSDFVDEDYGSLWNPTLYGDINAPGIKGRSSSAAANVRCQNSDYGNGYLAIAATSSRRYKHDIEDLTNEELNPERLYDLPVRQFVYNLDYIEPDDQRYGQTVCGFIAEEVEKIYPVACEYNADRLPENWDIRYIVPPMLALIQDQHKEIEQLKFDNLAMRGELDILKQELEELKNVINSKIN